MPSRPKTAIAIALSAALLLTAAVLGEPRGAAQAAGDAAAILQRIATERGETTRPLEYAQGAHPLDNFFAALARTALKQPGATTRIAHMGDSLVEMDLVSGEMRRRMQEKWGDAGHGFIHVSRPQPWYKPYDVVHEPSAEWIAYAINDTSLPDRHFGLGGGVSVAYKAKAEATIGTADRGKYGRSVSRFEVLFPIEPQGGPLEIALDGKRVGTVNTAGSPPRDAYAVVSAPDGAHKLTLTAMAKNLRVYGVIMERDVPGVVYDSLGVNGTGIDAYLTINKEHWINELRHRNPDLVILGFGGNEVRSNYKPEAVRGNVKAVVNIVRGALPNASILLVGPLDSAVKQGTSMVSPAILPQIIAAQREAASELKIAYWSLFDAMGGAGSMARWYEASPRLGAGDLVHPTPKGGEVLGDMFFRAMMQGFAEYLERAGVPAAAAPPPPANTMERVDVK
jgi:lysophospholipase L1-like esterase